MILKQWKQLQEMDAYTPLYKRFKKYFGYLNTGHKGKKYDVYPYNGGLFKPDEVLDHIKIDDELLYKYTLKLSEYDFASEVDVNILGHIFENSLNEIEEVQTQLEEDPTEVKLSKRKKDGVFYTPKYITKYIVQNTIGKLCEEKKIEANLVEEDYDIKRQAKTKKALLKKLNTYREWLLQLTIVDPACGSGAFLNEALNYLIAEHQYLDELETKLMGGGFVFPNVENSILENNLFGVDINNESVEIAKLSLWLRTAQPNRKLNDLSNNIKCGNSLIDDPEVAGDKAFNWENEFPQIFEKGGFDVVIGNPPYVRVQLLNYQDIDWLKANYKTAYKRIDISTLFFENSAKLLKTDGLVSFITSNQFLTTEYGRAIRGFIINNFKIEQIIDFGDLPVFEGALTYVSIFTFRCSNKENFYYYKVPNIDYAQNYKFGLPIEIFIEDLTEESWTLTSKVKINLLKKLGKFNKLGKYGNAWAGLFTGLDAVLMFDKKEMEKSEIELELFLPVIRASDPIKNGFSQPSKYVIYPYIEENNRTRVLTEAELQNKYPNGFKYLNQNKDKLQRRKDSRKTFKDRSDWYALTRYGRRAIFEQIKIVSPGEVKEHRFSIDNSNSGFSCARVFAITSDTIDIKFLTLLLNSELIKFYIQNNASVKAGGYFSYSSKVLNSVPILLSQQTSNFISFFDKLKTLNNDMLGRSSAMRSYIQMILKRENLSRKLENWNELNFGDFIKELNKTIKATNKRRAKEAVIILDENEERHETTPYVVIPTLTKKDEFEWMELFEDNKKKAQVLQSQIVSTEKEIDQMVYELYGLTEEEIEIVENS
jgi:hypothetical protein